MSANLLTFFVYHEKKTGWDIIFLACVRYTIVLKNEKT